MMVMRCLGMVLVLAAAGSAGAPVRAETGPGQDGRDQRRACAVRVVGIDASQRRCELRSVDTAELRLTCDGTPETVPLENVQSMSFVGAAEGVRADVNRHGGESGSESVDVFLADGGRLGATWVGSDEESIRVATRVGEVELDLSVLAGIRFLGGNATDADQRMFAERMAERLAGQDVLLVRRNGRLNQVRGRIVSLGREGGRIRLKTREFDFEFKSLAGIVFARGVGAPEKQPAVVTLIGGDRLPATILSGDDGAIRVRTGFAETLTVDADLISSIRFFSPRVVGLADLEPVRQAFSGLLHEDWPARFNRSATNRVISMAGQPFESGLGVHANSTLEYVLGGGYEAFVATIGIDDAVRPRGSVVFRVSGDGKTLFDSGPVTGRDAPRVVKVDVSRVNQLTLSVLDSDGLDLADHADWAGARLIKPVKSR